MSTDRADVLHGTLALMILRTLESMGPLHGYGIARRIEQISGNELQLNQGTLYPAMLKLEQLRWITSRWGASENNRRAHYYTISSVGRTQLKVEADSWTERRRSSDGSSSDRRIWHDLDALLHCATAVAGSCAPTRRST
jgi:transcriptional regulator